MYRWLIPQIPLCLCCQHGKPLPPMPSLASILHLFAPLGAGDGAPTPHHIIVVANLAYFAILVMSLVTLLLVMSHPIFSPTHTFVSPNAPLQASKTLLKQRCLFVFPTLKIVALTCPPMPPKSWGRGRVIALAQFRDNILVAAKGLGISWAMTDVCKLLQHVWSLRVLCPCISDSVHKCQLSYMTGNLYAMGIGMERHHGWGTMYVHPSALTGS